MKLRATKPADAFQPGDRIWFKEENGTVTERIYLDQKKNVSLGIRPDSGGPGDRWILPSDEEVEIGDPLPLWKQWLQKLKVV